MKVTFLCGSAEPGADGVGDYTRLLSAEIIRQGGEARIIALEDYQNLPDGGCVECSCEIQESDGIAVEVSRLPHRAAWRQKFQWVQQEVTKGNPDWICLQFVPYSFEKRGVPWNLASWLARVRVQAKWAIMFHELTIGYNCGSSLKERIIGKCQELIIRNLVFRLTPKTNLTQCDTYRALLKRWGIESSRIPLFGNVRASALNVRFGLPKSRRPLLGVMFGNVPDEWEGEWVFSKLLACCGGEADDGLRIVHVGRSERAVRRLSHLRETFHRKIEIECLGVRTTGEISELLAGADFGIATTPPVLIQKSGTAAAMMEHGLPVIDAGFEFYPRWDPGFRPILDPFEKDRLIAIGDMDGRPCAELFSKKPMESRLRTAALQFVQAVEA